MVGGVGGPGAGKKDGKVELEGRRRGFRGVGVATGGGRVCRCRKNRNGRVEGTLHPLCYNPTFSGPPVEITPEIESNNPPK